MTTHRADTRPAPTAWRRAAPTLAASRPCVRRSRRRRRWPTAARGRCTRAPSRSASASPPEAPRVAAGRGRPASWPPGAAPAPATTAACDLYAMTGTDDRCSAQPIPIWGFSTTGAAGSATAPRAGPRRARRATSVTVTLHNAAPGEASRWPSPASPPRAFTGGCRLGDDAGRRAPARRRGPTRFTAGRAGHVPLRGRAHRRRRPPGRHGPRRRARRAARRRHGVRRQRLRARRTTTRRCWSSARSTRH